MRARSVIVLLALCVVVAWKSTGMEARLLVSFVIAARDRADRDDHTTGC
jgi:hypothetical protein